MAGDDGEIAPRSQEKRVARQYFVAGAAQIVKDSILFPSGPDLGTNVVRQQLFGRVERVGADCEESILALLKVAQLSPDWGQQPNEFEEFSHTVVGTPIKAENRSASVSLVVRLMIGNLKPDLSNGFTASLFGSPWIGN